MKRVELEVSDFAPSFVPGGRRHARESMVVNRTHIRRKPAPITVSYDLLDPSMSAVGCGVRIRGGA